MKRRLDWISQSGPRGPSGASLVFCKLQSPPRSSDMDGAEPAILEAAAVLSPGVWHTVAMTHAFDENGTTVVYVNGTEVGRRSFGEKNTSTKPFLSFFVPSHKSVAFVMLRRLSASVLVFQVRNGCWRLREICWLLAHCFVVG